MVNTLNIIGAIASILGFLLTIYISQKVRSSKNKAQGITQINDIKIEIINVSKLVSENVPYSDTLISNEIVYRFESICDLILKYKIFSSLSNRLVKEAKKQIKIFNKEKSSKNWDKIFEYSIKLRSSIESDTKDIPLEGV